MRILGKELVPKHANAFGLPGIVSSIFDDPLTPWVDEYKDRTGLVVTKGLDTTMGALGRLYVIVPLVIFIIFVLLFGAFNSVGDALLIMLNLPFALIGGTLALFLWQSHFNISAAVGYIAVFGVSVLNGTVLVSSIRQAFADGLPLREAIARGCELRFRPIVVSAIVAVIGFLPAALSHGIGAEIQKPLARVVIGGLISSTALTLFVLPAVYALFAGGQGTGSGTPAAAD